MIREAYVSFEVAKLLKEKGFNERTLCYYISNGEIRESMCPAPWNNGVMEPIMICAPTQQKAMAWLREVCNVYMDISPTHVTNRAIQFVWQTYDSDYSVTGDCEMFYDSYEEAVEAAIKYSLENLI